MKVKIGKYSSYFTTSNMERKWNNFRFGSDVYVKENEELQLIDRVFFAFCDILQSVLNNTINVVALKLKRKVKIKIDDYDLWNMDHTLALIIHPLLIRMKNEKYSTPLIEDEDVPEEIRSANDISQRREHDWDKYALDRWQYVLDEMIWSFKQISDENSDDVFYAAKDEKIDFVGIKTHRKRIQNGLRLFGKYYLSLWT